MQTIRVLGASVEGTGAMIVTVEARFSVDPKSKATEIHLTGLPDSVLRESRGRLLCILGATRLRLGGGRLNLHLTPAARKKSGEALDLALVLAAACAGGHVRPAQLEGTVFVGEVGIDGRLHGVPGGLATAAAARRLGTRRLIAPTETAREASAIADLSSFGAASIKEVLALVTGGLEGSQPALPLTPPALDPKDARDPESLDEVRGQGEAKLALKIAAAGGHGLLMIGPPGAGKSMLARRLIDLLPPMDMDERIEVTSILSATGRWPRGLTSRRPFRAPHHTTSFAGLIGGGNPISAGEITLAHRGVLFLDELPEFGRESLEGLRQPLEDGAVHLSRASRRTVLPAQFQLVAAMNPCPCGYHGHPRIPCHCPPSSVRRYGQRISGPLMDRIDLRVSLQPAPVNVLLAAAKGPAAGHGESGEAQGEVAREGSGGDAREDSGATVGAAVLEARSRAAARARRHGSTMPPLNSRLGAADLDAVAGVSGPGLRLLQAAAQKAHLSARAIQSVRRVARTVADLREEESVTEEALAVALGLRGEAG